MDTNDEIAAKRAEIDAAGQRVKDAQALFDKLHKSADALFKEHQTMMLEIHQVSAKINESYADVQRLGRELNELETA